MHAHCTKSRESYVRLAGRGMEGNLKAGCGIAMGWRNAGSCFFSWLDTELFFPAGNEM